jgi:hypothetical protein
MLGGAIGYLAVKDEDKDIANNLLIVGIITTFIMLGLWIIFWGSTISQIL